MARLARIWGCLLLGHFAPVVCAEPNLVLGFRDSVPAHIDIEEPAHAAMAAYVAKNGALDQRVRYIFKEILHCPDWTTFKPDEVEVRREVTRLYTDLACFDNEAIRGALSLFKNRWLQDHHIDDLKKCYALMPIIFAIPPGDYDLADDSNRAFCAGQNKDGQCNFLWPYSLDRAGQLVLTGVNHGLRLAFDEDTSYDCVADFDALAEKFSRRSFGRGPSNDSGAKNSKN